MGNQRWKAHPWDVATPDGKFYASVNQAQILAVLMDLRDELKALNGVLQCPNFLAVPHKLERIARNTAKPKAKGSP